METQQQISALAREIMTLKEQECGAKEQRQAKEKELAALIATKDEGTDKAEAGPYKITITSKLTRTLNFEAYRAVEEQIPEGLRCVDMKPTLNLANLRAMDKARPGFSAQFITSKPASPGVKIELMEAA